MHRVRQSLPYFEEYGWEPTVVAVRPDRVEAAQDTILLQTVPKHIRVIHVNAFPPAYTRKVGLGSLALRSMWFYRQTVNKILRKESFDLIYFSTTQFPILVLSSYWKRKFKIPYVIDMQDPWHTEYYMNKPKSERPPKYWFAYNLNKRLEPIAMKQVDALLAVSASYNTTLQKRYPNIHPERCHTLTFGAFEGDMDVLKKINVQQPLFEPNETGTINVVYVGAVGKIMWQAIDFFFQGIKIGLQEKPTLFEKLRFFFVGTSYAAQGKGQPTVSPIAEQYGLKAVVLEHTDRVPYFQSLRLLADADILFMPGSDNPHYTASKLYPYILAKKPLLALFHPASSVHEVLKQTNAGHSIHLGDTAPQQVMNFFEKIIPNLPAIPPTNWEAFAPHLAKAKTARQVEIFEQAIAHFHAQ